MGVIYVEGQFKKATSPVKTVKGSVSSGGIDEDVLNNYVTKEELQLQLEELDKHTVEGETLIIK